MPKFLSSIDMNKNELQNSVIQNLGTAPGTPGIGQIYTDTSGTPVLKFWNGVSWITFSSGAGTVTSVTAGDSTITIGGTSSTPTIVVATGGITNTQINAGAGIAYSKLALTGTIVNTDIAVGAAIAYAKLNLTGSVINADIATGAAIAYSKLNLGASIINTDISASAAIAYSKLAAPIAAVNFNSQLLSSVATPVSSTDAATKGYVDSSVQGLSPKAPAIAASTGTNVSLTSAPATLDGITLASGNRILLKDQAAPSQNGIYVFVSAGSALVRATDVSTWVEIPSAYLWIEEGTVNADTAWVCTSDPGGTLGTTSIVFTQFANATEMTVSTPLYLSANNITLGFNARLINNAGNLDLASGVATAGTYQSVTVDTYGRVTAGTNITATAPITFASGVIAVGLSARVVNTAGNLDLASGIITPGTYQSVTVDTYGRVTTGAPLSTTNGFIIQTGLGSYTSVAITGTTNQITVTGGAGNLGNPVLSFATGARGSLGATGIYSATGSGSAATFVITQVTHGLGSAGANYCDVQALCYDISANPAIVVFADISINTSTGDITYTFATTQTLTNYKFVIIGK
jgi:hypothetical protein